MYLPLCIHHCGSAAIYLPLCICHCISATVSTVLYIRHSICYCISTIVSAVLYIRCSICRCISTTVCLLTAIKYKERLINCSSQFAEIVSPRSDQSTQGVPPSVKQPVRSALRELTGRNMFSLCSNYNFIYSAHLHCDLNNWLYPLTSWCNNNYTVLHIIA